MAQRPGFFSADLYFLPQSSIILLRSVCSLRKLADGFVPETAQNLPSAFDSPASTPSLEYVLMASTRRFWFLALPTLFMTSATVSADVNLPDGKKVDQVDFERHVMGLLGRMGCNSGSCHGSFQGKGGFRLSLFGYEPAKDYLALTRDELGRRVNPVDPDNSLLLLKATGQVAHGGGMRFGKDSWQYQRVPRVDRQQGAVAPSGSGEVKPSRVNPPELAFNKAGETSRSRSRPRSPTAPTTTSPPSATSAPTTTPSPTCRTSASSRACGRATRRHRLLPRQRLAGPRAGADGVARRASQYPKVPEVNYIDREVFAAPAAPQHGPVGPGQRRRVPPPRHHRHHRQLPTPDEVRALPGRQGADKRARRSTSCWPTRCTRRCGRPSSATSPATTRRPLEQPAAAQAKRSQMWHDWFRKRFADNMPYDEIVQGILTRHQPRRQDAGGVDRAGQGDRRRRIDKGFDTPTYADRASARPVLAAAAAPDADRAVGREDRGGVPGRPARVRPVPQAPVRPLDAGRLPGVRQHLRARSAHRHHRPKRRSCRRRERRRARTKDRQSEAARSTSSSTARGVRQARPTTP